MARVNVDTRVIQREQVIPAKTETEVVLTLTEPEAEALLSLVGKCKADGPTSPIYRALNAVCVTSGQYTIDIFSGSVATSLNGTIRLTKRDDLW